jgi:hypothetical protein
MEHTRTTRRELIRNALWLGGAAVLPARVALAAGAPTRQPVYFIHEVPGAALPPAAAAAGTTLLALRGDVTALWVQHLQPLWSRGPAVVAGRTRPAALHCLEALARRERHRVSWQRSAAVPGQVDWLITPVTRELA